MGQINKIPTDLELSLILDKWQVEMPDQQFFINLPAVVQQAALKPDRPWWRAVLAPLPVTSFIMAAVLAIGIATIQSRISTDNRISLTAAHWASENYGWSNIDEALKAMAEDVPASRDDSHEKYLSTLQKGTYLYGTDDAAQLLDELTETEMEQILSELQNTRS
jgi:hypothetical protein